MRLYIRHFPTELKISEKSSSSQSSSEIIQKPDWTMTVYNFMEKKIKPLPEFKQIIESIARRYKNNINILAKSSNEVSQSTFWLEQFIRKLIHEELEGTLSKDSIIEYASLFKSELELSPTEYKYVHHLGGIFLESDTMKINDNVLIRKVQKSDLEYTKDIFLDIPEHRYLGFFSSIMEIEISAKDERDCHDYINRIFNALRLYKLGSIYSTESISTKRTIIWPMAQGRSGVGRSYSASKKYTVKESEVGIFIDFVNSIEQKLNFDKEDKRMRSLNISIERYNSALLESVDIDRKLMTAVMGLESLFTFEKDRGENAFKLGIRVAKLLGHLNTNAEKVRTEVEKAYNFRNKVVHGSYISQEDRKKMNEILPHILNYLRLSLVIFLMNQGSGKDKMIEIIDNSTISDIRDRELNELVKKGVEELGDVVFQ